MTVDDLLLRYFGSRDISTLDRSELERGIGLCLLEIATEQDETTKLSMWTLLSILGRSPELDSTFTEEPQRTIARSRRDFLGLERRIGEFLQFYFGAQDPTTVGAKRLAEGIQRCRADLGLEEDPSERFYLWAFLRMLGVAPDIADTFNRPDDIQAAYAFEAKLFASKHE